MVHFTLSLYYSQKQKKYNSMTFTDHASKKRTKWIFELLYITFIKKYLVRFFNKNAFLKKII